MQRTIFILLFISVMAAVGVFFAYGQFIKHKNEERNVGVKKELKVVKKNDNIVPVSDGSPDNVINNEIASTTEPVPTSTQSVAKFGDMEAYGAKRGDKNLMILKSGDVEMIIDSADDDFQNKIQTTFSFAPKEFSPFGDYLVYTATGWEWWIQKIYNIKTEQIKEFSNGIYKFTPDQKFLYGCLPPGMVAGEGKIYSFPDYKLVYDLMVDKKVDANFLMLECGYDQEKNAVIFTGSDYYRNDVLVKEKQLVVYSLVDGSLDYEIKK